MKMESFTFCRTVLIFFMFPCVQCSESQTAVFLPEFALSPQGSFMEDATEDHFLTYRYDDQRGEGKRSIWLWSAVNKDISLHSFGHNHINLVKNLRAHCVLKALQLTNIIQMVPNETQEPCLE